MASGFPIPERAKAALEAEGQKAAGGTVPCYFCSAPVRVSARRSWLRVVGFTRARLGGGANQIVLRTPTGELACDTCIDRARSGVDPAQAAMEVGE